MSLHSFIKAAKATERAKLIIFIILSVLCILVDLLVTCFMCDAVTSYNFEGIITMQKLKVVPDVIDAAPEKILNISYSSGAKVDMGNVLTPTQVKDIPTVKWDADDAALYTLCLTDPDAPSRQNPKFREWHHWLVGNIPGSDVSKGDTLTEYVGSGPPKGTGLHRYVFVLYKQSGKVTFQENKISNKTGDNRGKFCIKKFAAKYKLGDPVAGNFFQAEWDDYVPKLYKQLAG